MCVRVCVWSSLCTSSSDESKCRQQQQDLEQSWTDRQKAEQSLQQIQARLEESEVSVEKLGSELILQQEQSEQSKT